MPAHPDRPCGRLPDCRGRPLCLPYARRKSDPAASHPDSPRIATGRCSCKPHPKIQPPKLHPQIGYRRSTPARGGQVPWVRRRPRRHTAQSRPRGIGALLTLQPNPDFGSASPAEDRCPGRADVLVGTRFSLARGGLVHRSRSSRTLISVQPRPRGTGTLGAPTSSSAHGSVPPPGNWCTAHAPAEP